MPLRINFYGGPGVGKSTLAARTYAHLNSAGRVSVELVQEFVKPMAYERHRLDRFEQIYTFGNQLQREHRLFEAGVEVIVTDSPILLQCVYARALDELIGDSLLQLAAIYERAYPSINFLVLRGETPYRQEGRYESPNRLQTIDAQIEAMVHENLADYHTVMAKDWAIVRHRLWRTIR